MRTRVKSLILFYLLVAGTCVPLALRSMGEDRLPPPPPPELKGLPAGKEGEEIRYGAEVLANTPLYLGPKGKVGKYIRTRMACRNCHLELGQKTFGNSWTGSHTAYPQFRAREGVVLSLAERTNNCFEHPVNGRAIPEDGREMRAILLYYKWLAKGKQVTMTDPDDRLIHLEFLKRPADPKVGKHIFKERCVICHGETGEGILNADKTAFVYPPLWGKESYQLGSSMSRISILARFLKANMPLGATAEKPALSDEEAWDLAAFVNSQVRPAWTGKLPFPTLASKSFDYPIGPYGDPFPAEQHKYGPFQPILEYWHADPSQGDITRSNINERRKVIANAKH